MDNLLEQIEQERQAFRAKIQAILEPCLDKYDFVSVDISINSLENKVVDKLAEDAGWPMPDAGRAVVYRSARKSSPSGGDTIIYSRFNG